MCEHYDIVDVPQHVKQVLISELQEHYSVTLDKDFSPRTIELGYDKKYIEYVEHQARSGLLDCISKYIEVVNDGPHKQDGPDIVTARISLPLILDTRLHNLDRLLGSSRKANSALFEQVNRLTAMIKQYNQLPWYKKLFRWKV